MASEAPLRFLHEVGETMVQVSREVSEEVSQEITQAGIETHVDQMHRPAGPNNLLQAAPFPDKRIDDVMLAKMVEMLETEDCDISFVARTFGQPESLVGRELAHYKARYRRYLLACANA